MPQEKLSRSQLDFRKTIAVFFLFSSAVAFAQETGSNVGSDTIKGKEKEIEQVVLVGYGSVKKTDLTGSVSTINSATITERNTTSPLEAIQGSTPGVNITSSTGRAGDGFKVSIRGNNSLTGSGNPLFVVDGVPLDNIDFLNPQDIARMDVLKDAASASIYGSRGASGVVIVTTKSGSTAKRGISVQLETSYGVKNAARLPQMMTGAEWWKFHQVAYFNANPLTQTPEALATLAGNESPLLVQRAKSGYTFDWYDAVLRPGAMQNHYVNLSGRADNGLAYNMSFGVQKDEGLIDKDSNEKYNFKLGMTHKINNKFSTGANVTIAKITTELGSDLAMQEAFRLSPLMSPWAIDVNGNELVGTKFFLPGKLKYPNGAWAINKTSTPNPLSEIANSYQTEKIWQALGNVFFQYQPTKWLSFKTTFSTGFSTNQLGISNSAETNAGVLLNKNSASILKTDNFNYTWDNQIDMKHTFGESHDFSLLLLQSMFYNEDMTSYSYAYGQPFDTNIYNLGSGTQTSFQVKSGYPDYSLNSFAARLNYAYKGKYLVTASTRYDGASVLSTGNQWESFPSLALAWRLSKESFLEGNSVVSDLKLRASIGYTGNNNVAPYTTKTLLDQQTFYANGTTVISGMQSKDLANSNLTWEKTRELNFGVDFGFLRNRITGTVDVYDRLSKDLIYQQQLPAETGWRYTYSNVGSVSNKGVEVLLTTKNVQSEKITWETTFTFTKNVNELVSIYGQDQVSDIGNNLILGSSLNPNYNYVYDGVWQENEAAQAAAYGQKPGMARPKDINGDGRFDAKDRAVIGSSVPKWQGSFYSRLTFGNFDFNFSVITSQGQTVLSTFHRNFADVTDRGRQKIAMDYFIPTNGAGIDANANNENPRPGAVATGAGAFWASGMAFYRDASFVKVKNISLGYTFSSNFLNQMKINGLRIYVNVLDPFVFTKFDGYDPEWASAAFGINRPASVTTQFGLSAKF